MYKKKKNTKKAIHPKPCKGTAKTLAMKVKNKIETQKHNSKGHVVWEDCYKIDG